ncbi:MAG: NAD(P)-binding protein, partial [Planctomycetota bacterium]
GIKRVERSALESSSARSHGATYCDGQVRLEETVDWPEGMKLVVTPAYPPPGGTPINGHVIIVGFGLAGRCVADLLDSAGMSYTIIERNPETVETQRALGRRVVAGDASDAQTLSEAGLDKASILALTIPDEEAVLEATSLARRLRPEIYIIARTNYSSKGMQATQLGADDVIMAEQAVALQFYDRLSRRL